MSGSLQHRCTWISINNNRENNKLKINTSTDKVFLSQDQTSYKSLSHGRLLILLSPTKGDATGLAGVTWHTRLMSGLATAQVVTLLHPHFPDKPFQKGANPV